MTYERHGASELLERATTGFRALGAGETAPEPEARHWTEVLDMGGMLAAFPGWEEEDDKRRLLRSHAKAVFKMNAERLHPDTSGGDEGLMRELVQARDEAMEALK